MSDATAGGLLLLFLMSAVVVLLAVAILVIVIRLLVTRNREPSSDATPLPDASTQKEWADLWEQKHYFEREAATLATALAELKREDEAHRFAENSTNDAAAALKKRFENELQARSAALADEFRARERQLVDQAEDLSAENFALNKTVAGLRKELALARGSTTRSRAQELESRPDNAGLRRSRAAVEPNEVSVRATAAPVELADKQEAIKAPPPKAAIVTRTSRVKTIEPPADQSPRAWTAREDTELLETYVRERSIPATAINIQVDQIEVAQRLVTLLLGPKGEIDDPSAPNHGKTYSKADQSAIPEAWREGRKLPAIARMFDRDQLGVGWRLLDDPSQPVELTAEMIPDIVEEAHR